MLMFMLISSLSLANVGRSPLAHKLLLRLIHTRVFTPGASSRVNLHDWCTQLGSIAWKLAPYYGTCTQEGAF